MDFVLSLLTSYGVLLVFAWVLIEQFGVPIPAFPVILVAGSLSAQGSLSLPLLLAASVGACLIADYGWYLAGTRYGSRVLRLMCKLSLTPDTCVTQTETLFDRWGARSLIVAKFVPGFASIATAMAGAVRVKPLVFLTYDMVGSALWSGSALALGWTFSSALETALSTLHALGQWGITLIVTGIGAYIARKYWSRFALKRRMRMPRIAVRELQKQLDSVDPPLLLDVRKPGLWELEHIPGSLCFNITQWSSAKNNPYRHAKIVVYCDCPSEASAVIIAQQLKRAGFKFVSPLDGGLEAWRQAGLRLLTAGAGHR